MLNTPQGDAGGDRLGLLQRSGLCTLPSDGQGCSYEAGHTLLEGDEFRDSLGKRHDWIIYVDWTAEDEGHIQVWHRTQGPDSFERVLNVEDVPTLKKVENDDGEAEVATVYSKYGIYRPEPQDTTHIMHNDSYCVAKWLDAAKTCFA